MKKKLYLIALLAVAFLFPAVAQQKVTGFSNLKLYIDPGHYQTYNLGYGGYSEAEKSLQVAYALKEYMTTYTDMPAENIKFSRLTDSDTELPFQTKADQSYAMGAHFFYSIHSDAPSVISYATVFLYGGRRLSSGATPIEKLPEGGKLFGDILNGDLTGVLRAIRSDGTVRPDASRGNINDLVFYSYDAPSSQLVPYLAVNRTTASTSGSPTPSIVSEAGFHTNPAQNMQFINVEHKRMQAYAAYQSLVRYLSEKNLGARIDPVQVGIATGFVFDKETYRPVNGAKITVTESGKEPKIYTTDTYASLPKKYNFRPDEFGNGFYWLEGFTPGATVDLKVEATGFESQKSTITIPATVGTTTIDGLGVKDFQLLNQLPAKVKNVATTNDLGGKVIARYPMDVVFDRKMDKATVEAAISITPAASVTYTWPNDFTLRIDISGLAFETGYTLTIDGSVAKNDLTGDYLDGDGNGTPGGNYTKAFTTSDSDTDPPKVVSYDPQGVQEESYRPIVRIEFDEYLNELSFGHTPITVTDNDGVTVEGLFSYYTTKNFKSVMHYVFNEDLIPGEKYTVALSEGIEDMYGNAMTEKFTFVFKARPRHTSLIANIADFNNSYPNWWDVTGSGSTVGVVKNTPLVTKCVGDSKVKPVVTDAGSVRMDYQWDASYAGNPVIRWHNTVTGSPTFATNNTAQYYLFGDGSNTRVAFTLRVNGGGNFFAHEHKILDWVGWKLISWDMADEPFVQPILGGTDKSIPSPNNASCFVVYPSATNRNNDIVSSIFFSRLRVVKLGDFVDTGIEKVNAEKGISVASQSGFIKVSADAVINDIKLYSITGALLKSIQPQQASFQIPTNDLAQGAYIVKVTTATTQKSAKALVK